MANLRVRTSLCVLTLFSTVGAVQAQNRPVAAAADVAGCWVSIQLSEPLKRLIQRPDFQEPMTLVMCFEGDGSLRTIAESQPAEMHLADVQRALAQGAGTMTYKIIQPGVLEQVLDDKRTIAWVANFTQRENTLLGTTIPQGSLALGVWDQRQQKAVHWRYMARVPQ